MPSFITLALAVFLASAAHAESLTLPAGGTDITSGTPLQANISAGHGKAEALAEGGQRIVVEKADASKPYRAQFTALCPATEISKGDRILAIVKARVLDGDKGIFTAKLQFKSPPYTAASDSTEVDVYRDWREFPLLFIATDSIPLGQAAVVVLCGQQVQRLEIASIRVLRYPASMEVAAFPRIQRSYVGREADAPWRAAALERIERERKADLSMAVTDAAGKPLANAEVRLSLRRHAFGFGSAVTVQKLVEDSDDARRYRDIIERYFSSVVFENDLKDFNWSAADKPEKRADKQADMDKAFAWLAARHITVRGHYLMQVAVPYNLAGVKDMATIREHFLQATRERMAFVKDRVSEWDVINHPIAWASADLLSTRPGYEHLDREVFKLARSLTTLPLCVNEDQIFRPGPQHDDTFAYIKALNAAGLTVAALGNQAHFHESYLPSPEHLLAVTDHFAKVVPRQLISEFDVVTTADEALAADYTRDVLIACFSHSAYSSFLWWGFWEGSHWKPEAAMWNKDWSPRKSGEVIEEWLGKRWHTEVTVKTNAQGIAHWRGFPGWYQVGASETLMLAK